jgi:hypothetical protein
MAGGKHKTSRADTRTPPLPPQLAAVNLHALGSERWSASLATSLWRALSSKALAAARGTRAAAKYNRRALMRALIAEVTSACQGEYYKNLTYRAWPRPFDHATKILYYVLLIAVLIGGH